MYSQHSNSQSDEELWLQLKGGDKEALRFLFLRYHDSLYQYGCAVCSARPVAEDCLQELFYQLWQNHQTLSEVKKVKGYLWISFRRRLMKQLKKQNKEASITTLFVNGMKKESSAEQSVVDEEQQIANHKVLQKVLETLSHREREVLFLKYYEGMSYSEIEEILEVEYQTARNYIYRALSRLRETLQDEELKIILSLLLLVVFI